MDLDFLIFPAPRSTYDKNTFREGELIWIPKIPGIVNSIQQQNKDNSKQRNLSSHNNSYTQSSKNIKKPIPLNPFNSKSHGRLVKPEIFDRFKNKPQTRLNFNNQPPRILDKDLSQSKFLFSQSKKLENDKVQPKVNQFQQHKSHSNNNQQKYNIIVPQGDNSDQYDNTDDFNFNLSTQNTQNSNNNNNNNNTFNYEKSKTQKPQRASSKNLRQRPGRQNTSNFLQKKLISNDSEIMNTSHSEIHTTRFLQSNNNINNQQNSSNQIIPRLSQNNLSFQILEMEEFKTPENSKKGSGQKQEIPQSLSNYPTKSFFLANSFQQSESQSQPIKIPISQSNFIGKTKKKIADSSNIDSLNDSNLKSLKCDILQEQMNKAPKIPKLQLEHILDPKNTKMMNFFMEKSQTQQNLDYKRTNTLNNNNNFDDDEDEDDYGEGSENLTVNDIDSTSCINIRNHLYGFRQVNGNSIQQVRKNTQSLHTQSCNEPRGLQDHLSQNKYKLDSHASKLFGEGGISLNLNDKFEQVAYKQKKLMSKQRKNYSMDNAHTLLHKKNNQNLNQNQKEQNNQYIPCLLLQAQIPTNITAVYFHGNGEDIKLSYQLLDLIRKEVMINIIAIEYPGYGLYKGSCSEEKMLQDGEYIINYVTKQLNFKLEDIIIIGRSIGSGVALHLAAQFKVMALILISPFTSLKAVVKHLAGNIASYLIKERFENLKNIIKVQSPIYIVHGQKDTMIPYEHSIKLQQSCHHTRCRVDFPSEMTHIEIDFQEDIIKPLKQFLLDCCQGFKNRINDLIQMENSEIDNYLIQFPLELFQCPVE